MDLELTFERFEDQLWLLHEGSLDGVLDMAHRYSVRMEFIYRMLLNGQRRQRLGLDSSQ